LYKISQKQKVARLAEIPTKVAGATFCVHPVQLIASTHYCIDPIRIWDA